MTRRLWIPALTMAAVLGASGTSRAQEMRADVKSDGVLIGAGTGAAAGVVIGLVDEEICSPGACAYLGAIVGGLMGHLIDRKISHPRPVAPGSLIDDGLGNGALFGALGGVGIALVDAKVGCKPRPDRGPCTGKGILLNVSAAARWMAIVGLVIDAAIPSRLQGSGAVPERPQRRVAVRVNLTF
jgi:hypothetical protein